MLPPFFLGQRVKEQWEGGRKDPIAVAFTLRELERKWIKWLI